MSRTFFYAILIIAVVGVIGTTYLYMQVSPKSAAESWNWSYFPAVTAGTTTIAMIVVLSLVGLTWNVFKEKNVPNKQNSRITSIVIIGLILIALAYFYIKYIRI